MKQGTQSDPGERALVDLRHLAHCVGVYGLGFVAGHGFIGGLTWRVTRRCGYALVPRAKLNELLRAANCAYSVSGTENGEGSRR